MIDAPALDADLIQTAPLDALTFFLTGTNAEDYDEMPADIETFVLSEKYLNLRETARPAVIRDLKALFCDPTVFASCPYDEAVFDEAIGTGKTFKTTCCLAYGLHVLLCLHNPHKYFGIDPASLIVMMNMSINQVQAKKVVFGELRQRILNSPWFQNHMPDPNIHSQLLFEKNIAVIPGHSGETYPLGFNLIMAVMDEAAFYPSTPEHDVAQDMFYAIKRRQQTRFGKKALLVMISSPRYTEDFIERKMAEAVKEPHRIFARRHAIWDVIPEDQQAIADGDYFVFNDTAIPNRYIDDFDKNADKAWRDLGALPSLALEPYIKQIDAVRACISPDLLNPVIEGLLLADFFKPKMGTTYYMHLDLALRSDACGIAMAHKEIGGIVIVDLMVRIKGSKEKEIDLNSVTQFVVGLKGRGFKLGKVTFDQFQSASSIQELKKHFIPAELLSVDKTLAPYETLKELCYTGKVKFYYHEVFMSEMERLELIDGKKVDHPAKGSKDVADAVAGAVYNTVQGVGGSRVPVLKIL